MARPPELAASLRLDDLVANRTMSPEIATLLATTARERRSFLVMAVPRLAGKSTVMRAMLAEAPADAPMELEQGDGSDLDALLARSRGGYLVVPEFSRGAFAPGYIWGAAVRRVLRGLASGVSLAAALHAPGVAEAFDIICGEIGVPDEDASRIELVVYLRSLGADWQAPERRVVASVHEIDGVAAGRPKARLLYRWNEHADRFESLATAERIGRA